jgi:hypothetical protein
MEKYEEIWKSVNVDEDLGKFFEVSNKGNVRSLKTINKTVLKQHDRCGYKSVNLEIVEPKKKKTYNVHKLVANAFLKLPKIDKPVINHKDGNKFNNNSDNLEFISNSENVKHAMSTGLRKNYTLKVNQYDKDMNLIKKFNSIKEASDKTGCADNRISQACKGKLAHVGGFIWEYDEKCNGDIHKVDISDDNIIRQVDGFSNYYVTKEGKIYSKSHMRMLSQKTDGSGYKLVTLYNKKNKNEKLVHRLVAQAFIENPDDKAMVNHKNKIKSDNNIDNLEWVSASENMIHSNKK